VQCLGQNEVGHFKWYNCESTINWPGFVRLSHRAINDINNIKNPNICRSQAQEVQESEHFQAARICEVVVSLKLIAFADLQPMGFRNLEVQRFAWPRVALVCALPVLTPLWAVVLFRHTCASFSSMLQFTSTLYAMAFCNVTAVAWC
jgi:hypothetical protein